MEELGDIDSLALVAFHPGMRDSREKLQWMSARITTLQEDIACSLFGIFGTHIPVIYWENKQNALERLLQEIIAKSGDITCLDWIGKSPEFNSCLPASITSYGAPPSALASSLSEGEMQTSVSSLRDAVDVELASRLYQTFDSISAPKSVASPAATALYCIRCNSSPTKARRRPSVSIAVNAAGLRDLFITTEHKLIQFSRARPIRQSFLLVHPWDRSLLEPHDFED